MHHTQWLVVVVSIDVDVFEWVLLMDESRGFIILDVNATSHITAR